MKNINKKINKILISFFLILFIVAVIFPTTINAKANKLEISQNLIKKTGSSGSVQAQITATGLKDNTPISFFLYLSNGTQVGKTLYGSMGEKVGSTGQGITETVSRTFPVSYGKKYKAEVMGGGQTASIDFSVETASVVLDKPILLKSASQTNAIITTASSIKIGSKLSFLLTNKSTNQSSTKTYTISKSSENITISGLTENTSYSITSIKIDGILKTGDLSFSTLKKVVASTSFEITAGPNADSVDVLIRQLTEGEKVTLEIKKSGTLIESLTPQPYRYQKENSTNNRFLSTIKLGPGVYTVEGSTDKGRKASVEFTIRKPDDVGGTIAPVSPVLDYYPLAPLPGIGETCTADKDGKTTCVRTAPQCDSEGKNCTPGNGFGNYLNVMLNLFIGICAILAMIMIVMGGIQYMTSELVSSKEAGKETITNAVFGLILALGAFAILNTINPDLLNVGLNNMEGVTLEADAAHEERLAETRTTDVKFIRTPYYEKIKSVAKKYNVPHCLLQVAIQRESRGNPNVIGHDENVAKTNIKSRRDFIASGKKFKGETFTANDKNLITTRTFLNNDGGMHSVPNPNAEDLGLDWRFSHGIGLLQVTLFPEDKANGFSRVKPKTLYNPDTAIDRGAKIMSGFYSQCKGNIEQTFRGFGAGSCNGNTNESPLRTSLYNQCVAQDK